MSRQNEYMAPVSLSRYQLTLASKMAVFGFEYEEGKIASIYFV
jgi:hypothetical protein